MREHGDYALELFTPVRHVATMIGAAAPAAVSIKEMAATYKDNGRNGDLHRIKVNEGLFTDAEATEWLMQYAVERIMHRGEKGRGVKQIVRENGAYKLADGMSFDDLEYEGKPIGREPPDPHKMFRDPFNPMSGIFSENIRANGKDDLKDLVESIEAMGYVQDPGIVKDERGVVFSGHRRLAALEKAGIDPTPYITIKRFGDGDAADVERLKFAIALNTGQKPFTPKDRKRIAEYLYGTGEWSMPKIGDLLKVDCKTIATDLEGIPRTAVIGRDGRRHASKNLYDGLIPAVMTERDAGASLNALAKKYGINKQTISRWDNNRNLGVLLEDVSNKGTSSSSKIPEDQQQAFLELVRNGKPQAEAVTAVTGKAVKPIPTAFRTIFNQEEGRRKALAEIAQQQPVPQQPTIQHQCTCPNCGHVHNRKD